MSLANSAVYNNTALNYGGGIYTNGTLTVTSSAVYSNAVTGGTGSLGGGIFNNGTLSMTNDTIAGNSAADGGGIYTGGALTLINSTLASNSGNGLFGSSLPTFYNTLAANNTPANCSTAVTDGGGNLSYGDATCPGINTDPKLGPLANNGGSTKTMALLRGSAAIDAGSNTYCPATDQRGYHRPLDGDGNGTATCDIGAYEAPQNLFLPIVVK